MAIIEWVASSMMAGKIAGYYTAQNTIAFDGFESITVLEGDLKQDGQTVGKVGKGYPVSGTERFIGTCHNKVTLQSKQTNAFEQYQAHAINHRPLMIMFSLERDLSDREKDLMASAPLKIEFQFYNFTLNDLHSVTFEIPLDGCTPSFTLPDLPYQC